MRYVSEVARKMQWLDEPEGSICDRVGREREEANEKGIKQSHNASYGHNKVIKFRISSMRDQKIITVVPHTLCHNIRLFCFVACE